MKRYISGIIIILVTVGVMLPGFLYGLDIDGAFVTDQAQIIDEEVELLLTQKIQQIQKDTSAEIAIVTMDSLGDRDPFEVAFSLAQYETDVYDPDRLQKEIKTGVGDKEADNGVLVLVAPNERKRQILVGYGLEGAIPDVTAKRLGEDILVPAFRKKDYGKGLISLTDTLRQVIRGEYEVNPIQRKQKSNVTMMDLFVFGMFIALIFGPMLKPVLETKRKKRIGSGSGSTATALLGTLAIGWSALRLIVPLVLIWLVVLFGEPGEGGSYSGGYGGSSFGGGGFSGFGGGSFGGGGAGGSR